MFISTIKTNAQWVNITPSDTTFGFGTMSFVTDQIGFIAGNNSEYLSKTTDGGTTWSTIQTSNNTLVSDLHFVTPSVGYITGNNVFPTNLYNVSKTIDGGITWQPIAPELNSYTSVYFKDANVGFATSQWSGIFKTINGGVSWVKEDSTGFQMADKSFYSSTSDTGYFAGWDGTFGYQGIITKTTDNGNTWTSIIPMGWNSSISNIHMINNTTGFFVLGLWGSANGQYIYKTQNAFVSLDSVLKPVQNVYDIYFLSENEGYLFADSGVYHTSDGLNFTQELAFTNGQYYGRFEKSGNTLFVSTGSKVYKKQLITSIEEEQSKNNFIFYPNPTSSTVFIEGEYVGQIELTDITGKLLKQIKKTDSKIEVSVSDLPKGFYLIKVGNRAKKLIVN